MRSFSALTLLPAFVLALTALSSNHNNCNGQQQIQGAGIYQRHEDTAESGTIASTAEDIEIPRSYLRRSHSRRINNHNAALQRRGLLDTLIPSQPHSAGTSTMNPSESSLSSPPPATTDAVASATTASAPISHPSSKGVSSPSPLETTHLTSSEPPPPSLPPITPTTTHTDETTSDVVPPTPSPAPPVTTDPLTSSPPVTTDPAPPTTVPVPPTSDPIPPATTTTTEAPVTTTATQQPTVPPTSVPPPVTSEATVPPVTTSTVPPVVVPTSKSRGPVPPPVTSNGGSHVLPTGSGHEDPSSTASSSGLVRPSEAATSGSSTSNKTGITIGVVIGAIVVCAGIGVWVFRKWKLSPSRQFKSKIRNSSSGGSAGGLGSGRSLEDDDIEYANYTDIFRPAAHDSSLPITATSMTTASVSAAAVGSGRGANLARGGSGSAHSTTSGSSPSMQHAQQQQQQHVYYEDPYGQQLVTSGPLHQQHMSLSSTGTVPDYSQYRYPGTQQPMMMSGGHGYDSGVTGSILGGGGGQQQPLGPMNGHPHTSYASSDYPATDFFLRELRE